MKALTLLISLVLGVAAMRGADTMTPAQMINKARAYVGDETALNAVKSIHYVGTIETTDPENPAKKVSMKVDMVFQKPYQQRVIVSDGMKTDVTALDDYDAWQRQDDSANPDAWTFELLTGIRLRSLRSNTWENLNFYRGIEATGGSLEDGGASEVAGVKCRKLVFHHVEGLLFIRHFAVDSGKLMMSETEQGLQIREVGELRAGGIRFPKQIVSTQQGEKGEERAMTITFDRITLNENFPSSAFQVPPMKARKQ